MIFTHELKFKESLPSYPEVFAAIQNITGLSGIDFEGNERGKISVSHPFFPDPEFYLDFSNKTCDVVVWTKSPKVGYLMEATVAAISKLGGEYEYELNPLAYKKWDEVKDQYVETFVIDPKENLY